MDGERTPLAYDETHITYPWLYQGALDVMHDGKVSSDNRFEIVEARRS
jgi:hypothetical protein